MKIIILMFSSIVTWHAFAYTIGDIYVNSVYQQSSKTSTTSGTNTREYVQNFDNQNYKITTNSVNIITRIDYIGQQPIDIKSSLGKYYPSYHQAWLNRKNKFNRTSSNVTDDHVTVKTFGIGGKLFETTILLNNP